MTQTPLNQSSEKERPLQPSNPFIALFTFPVIFLALALPCAQGFAQAPSAPHRFGPGGIGGATAENPEVVVGIRGDQALVIRMGRPEWTPSPSGESRPGAALVPRPGPYQSVLIPRYAPDGRTVGAYERHTVLFLVHNDSSETYVFTTDGEMVDIGFNLDAAWLQRHGQRLVTASPNIPVRVGETPLDAIRSHNALLKFFPGGQPTDTRTPLHLLDGNGEYSVRHLAAQADAAEADAAAEKEFGERRAARAAHAEEGAGTKIDPKKIARDVSKE